MSAPIVAFLVYLSCHLHVNIAFEIPTSRKIVIIHLLLFVVPHLGFQSVWFSLLLFELLSVLHLGLVCLFDNAREFAASEGCAGLGVFRKIFLLRLVVGGHLVVFFFVRSQGLRMSRATRCGFLAILLREVNFRLLKLV